MAKANKDLVGQKTNIPHVELLDVDDNGVVREIAIVKREKAGTIHYIDIDKLSHIDKVRLRNILASPHANKYELWELLSMTTINNGMNALEFFHNNFVKVKRPVGARATSSSISSIAPAPAASGNMIGSEFSNPSEAELDGTSKVFA